MGEERDKAEDQGVGLCALAGEVYNLRRVIARE